MSKKKKLFLILMPSFLFLLAGTFTAYWFLLRDDPKGTQNNNSSEVLESNTASVVLTEVEVDSIEKIKSDNASDAIAAYTALIASGMKKSYAGDCRDSNDYFKEAANLTQDESLRTEAYVFIYSCAKSVNDQNLIKQYEPLIGNITSDTSKGMSQLEE